MTRAAGRSRVLVVGGGIGGLTTAVALRAVGAEVEIVERAPGFATVGAGITVQANAAAVLDALGIELPADDVVAIGEVEMISGGRVVMRSDSRALSGVPPSVNIHRADLHAALLRAASNLPRRLGVEVRGVREDDDGVRVTFADGSEERWDLVVGADGVHSAVRASLLEGEPPPRYAGQTCWRFALFAPDLVPEVTVERWTPGRRIGVVPLSRGRIYVYLVESSPPGTPSPTSASAEALRRFAGIDERVDAMLPRLDGVAIHHGDLLDRPDISFGRGRVVLLGDAAHAMTPNLGQGAGMAVEDAAALALAFSEGASDLPRALERARLARVRHVSRTSWQVGRVAHLRNPILRWGRDRMLGLLPASLSQKQALALWAPGFELAAALRERLAQRPASGL